MTTRRELITGGLAASLLPLISKSAPVKSMLGADKESFLGGPEIPTAEDYVQDGLIVMWDGIENAGLGIHDDEAAYWIPAVGDASLKIPATSYWTENALFIDRKVSRTSTNISNSDSFRMLTDAVNARSLTFQNVWTLYEYGTSVGSGLGEAVRNVMGPGSVYGHLCARSATSVWLNANGSGNGYYWSSAKNIGDVGGTHALTATYTPYGARAICGLYHGSVPLIQDAVLPDQRVADENVSFANLRSSTWYIGAYSNLQNTVDEIHCYRIYNRPLSAEEIAYNYLIDKMRFGL